MRVAALPTRIVIACSAAFAFAAGSNVRAQAPVDVLYSFQPSTTPELPRSIIQASDGNFYGMTVRGGPYSPQGPSIYRMTPDGVVTVILDGWSSTGLLRARDG